MYRCLDCGKEFEELDVREDPPENLDGENGWWVHRYSCCPWCGETDFEELEDEDEYL